MSHTATFAPSAANLTAVECPIPRAPPVMMATFPVSIMAAPLGLARKEKMMSGFSSHGGCIAIQGRRTDGLALCCRHRASPLNTRRCRAPGASLPYSRPGLSFSLVVQRDPALASKRAPACDVGLDESSELLGGHRHRLDRFPRQALLQRRRGSDFVDLGVELLRDRRGQLRDR